MSTAALLEGLNPAQREAFAMRALAEIARRKQTIETKFHLPVELYEKQLPPEGDDWRVRLFLAGRMAGKTLAGAAWAAQQAMSAPSGSEGLLIGPTFRDVREVMVEGPSGILKMLGSHVIKYNRSQWEIELDNSTKILMRSADKLGGVLGTNLTWAWADELCRWVYPEVWYEEIMLAVRIGDNPQAMATTTPRANPLMLKIWDQVLDEDDNSIVVQTATSHDNPHISEKVKEEIRRQFEGTALYEREVLGKMVLTVEGAIWTLDDIRHETNAAEIARNGGMRKIIVSVDPSSQMDGLGDDFAIIVLGIDRKGIIWILADKTLRGGDKWKYGEKDKLTGPGHGVQATVDAFNATYTELAFKPHAVLVEGSGNIGGYAKDLFGRIAPGLPLEFCYPKVSKGDRARSVLPLWQNETVRHLGSFPLLEDEQTTWNPEESKWSPNRIDAVVQGVAFLQPAEKLLTDLMYSDDRLSGYGR